jgi:hypothetical protein
MGYGPEMFDYHGDRAVTIAGVVECRYPWHGRGGKKGKPGKAERKQGDFK